MSLPSQQELITALLAWNQMRRYVVIAIEKNGRTLCSNDNDGLISENVMSFSKYKRATITLTAGIREKVKPRLVVLSENNTINT